MHFGPLRIHADGAALRRWCGGGTGRYISFMESDATETQVLYNDTCPVCRFEIDGYRRLAEQENLPIRFDPIAAAGQWGLTADLAAQRLHVIHDGRLLSGIPAFISLWSAMPRWQWVAQVVGLPGIKQLACGVYDYILAPVLYRAHLRRELRLAVRSDGNPD